MNFDVLLSPPDTGVLEEEAVLRAMRSGWVAPAGPDLDAFEHEVAARVGRQYAVALASGTSALHLALVSWGVGPGDVVPVSTMTFAASINAIRYTGATPMLIDSEGVSGNINVDLLDRALAGLRADGRRIPCVLPVDLLGRCADYTRIAEVTSTHGVRVLADAAESLGASHGGRPAGGFGDSAVVSFNGNKVMTTSGGGMLLTDDAAHADHVRKLSTQAREPVSHYEHREIGYNYRLSNLLAALGRAQLSRLEEMIGRRRAWRRRYRQAIAGVPGVRLLGDLDNVGDTQADERDNCWLTALIIDPDIAPMDVRALHEHFAAAAVETRPVWKPMHRQPVYESAPALLDGTADRLFAQGLTLPSGSAMTEAQFSQVLKVLEGLRR